MNHTDTGWTEDHQQNSEPDFYGKWIDVKRELPGIKVDVLISDGVNVGHACKMIFGWRIAASNDHVTDEEVTHWMEKPVPPNK